MPKQLNLTNTPKHVCIIMDGNRRWARKRKLQVFKGHEKMAYEGIESLARHAIKRGISHLTLWAFSTENWKRDKKEVDALMNIFRKLLDNNLNKLAEEGVRFNIIGDMSRFADDIQQKSAKLKKKTAENDKIVVTMALNYGGHDEIIRAQKKMYLDLLESTNPKKVVEQVEPEKFEQYLDTADLPKPDLIIRPGGEIRLSGFMSWQSAYAELYFSDALMPDFNEEEFDKALIEFDQRSRRFGA